MIMDNVSNASRSQWSCGCSRQGMDWNGRGVPPTFHLISVQRSAFSVWWHYWASAAPSFRFYRSTVTNEAPMIDPHDVFILAPGPGRPWGSTIL